MSERFNATYFANKRYLSRLRGFRSTKLHPIELQEESFVKSIYYRSRQPLPVAPDPAPLEPERSRSFRKDQRIEEPDSSKNCDKHVNDVHSKLNRVAQREIVQPRSLSEIRFALRKARRLNVPIITSGGRHSMGGQQFRTDGIMLDMRLYNRVLSFDRDLGLIKVQPGMMWSQLIQYLNTVQDTDTKWSIIQKPTGADNISIGGSISSNIHGRGLKLKPFIQDVEELELLNADGKLVSASRQKNAELFKLTVGGFGLFGIVVSVTLRLRPRKLMRRVVETTTITEVIDKFNERISVGHEYGDFQFAIDHESEEFLYKGILATYVPTVVQQASDVPTSIKTHSASCVPTQTQDVQEPSTTSEHKLSLSDWQELLKLAHTAKTEAFQKYVDHYLKTNNQQYYSDTMQLSTYMDDYHTHLDKCMGSRTATEIITELYVPRDRLTAFMGGAAEFLRRVNANVIYGTIRLIEADDESFMPWAKQNYACIIFNIHTEHHSAGIEKSKQILIGLIKQAQTLDGSYYLTYHRFADKQTVQKSYPQFSEFLKLKLKYDPKELFQSEWYIHYRGS